MSDITVTPTFRLLLTVPGQARLGDALRLSMSFTTDQITCESTFYDYSATIEEQIRPDGSSDNTLVDLNFESAPSLVPGLDAGQYIVESVVVLPTLDGGITAIVLNLSVPLNLDFAADPTAASLTLVLNDVAVDPTTPTYASNLIVSSDRYIATPNPAQLTGQTTYPPNSGVTATSTAVSTEATPESGSKRNIDVTVPISITSSNPSSNSTFLGLCFSLVLTFKQRFK